MLRATTEIDQESGDEGSPFDHAAHAHPFVVGMGAVTYCAESVECRVPRCGGQVSVAGTADGPALQIVESHIASNGRSTFEQR